MWTQGLRLLLWEIMEKFMELRAAAKELHAIDSTFPMHESEMLTRDNAYQKILACFPQGWMTVSEITRQYSLLKEKVSNQEQAARRRTESRELMEHQDTEQQQQQQQLSRTRRPLSVATSTPSTEFRRYSPVSATMSSPTTNDSYQPISPAMSPVRAMVQVPLREDGNREVKVPDNNVNNQHQTSEERRQSNDTATTRRYIESSHRMSQPPFSKSHTIEQHHRHQRQYQQQHQQQQYHQQHQPQQRQYLAPPQTSSRPTTTDSVPKHLGKRLKPIHSKSP
ncbi:hypothetical protein BGZ58_002889 [Dissophora ornata]|nr:hypothetical protein BGZ58_002889 [Dissophora ornata]